MTQGDVSSDVETAGCVSGDVQARQDEMPFAMVCGKAVTELPKDLYIPPEALEVFLETFEGPLDLLLYLIRRQNLDILEVNVARVTQQYIAYVETMSALQFELAAEYLVMAAVLAEIKSRTLLPRQPLEEEEGGDPRIQLVLRLQEYERYKEAAEAIDLLPRIDREIYPTRADIPEFDTNVQLPDLELKELLVAFSEVMHRADMFRSHRIAGEKLSTRERMSAVLNRLQHTEFVGFSQLFEAQEGRLGVVVTFLAILELMKESMIEIVQSQEFAEIHLKKRDQ